MGNSTARRLRAARESFESAKAAAEAEAPLILGRAFERVSLRRFAELSGLSPTYLSMIHRGLNRCSPGAFLKICKAYDDL